MQSEMPVYAWRPFDVAQDRLGAINLLKVIILNIFKTKNLTKREPYLPCHYLQIIIM